MIAVLCAGDFIDEHDIAQALFGQIEYRLGTSSGRADGDFQPGGLWHDGRGARYTRVSAVLTASNLTPDAVAAVEPRLWLNPAAAHPIDPSSLPWRRLELDPSGRFVEHPPTMTSAGRWVLPDNGPPKGQTRFVAPNRDAPWVPSTTGERFRTKAGTPSSLATACRSTSPATSPTSARSSRGPKTVRSRGVWRRRTGQYLTRSTRSGAVRTKPLAPAMTR